MVKPYVIFNGRKIYLIPEGIPVFSNGTVGNNYFSLLKLDIGRIRYEEVPTVNNIVYDESDLSFPTEEQLKTFVKNYVHGDVYPEDEWIALNSNWDINLWIRKEGNKDKKLFTAYPIYGNHIDTSKGITFTYHG